VAVQVGQVCPEGSLPVYSCDTEADAKLLVGMACKMNLAGEHYAPELLDDFGQPLESEERMRAFVSFGQRLAKLHQMVLDRRQETLSPRRKK